MSVAYHDFTAEQGATFDPVLTYHDPAGAPMIFSGYTARMHVRESYGATAPVLSLTTENGGITLSSGTIALLVSATQMGELIIPDSGGIPPIRVFFYDLELIVGTTVTRLLGGKFIVSRGVTR